MFDIKPLRQHADVATFVILCGIGVPLIAQSSDMEAAHSRESVRRMEQRQAHEDRQRLSPFGRIPPRARRRALDQISQSKLAKDGAIQPAGSAGFLWFNIGPDPIDRQTGDAYV